MYFGQVNNYKNVCTVPCTPESDSVMILVFIFRDAYDPHFIFLVTDFSIY